MYYAHHHDDVLSKGYAQGWSRGVSEVQKFLTKTILAKEEGKVAGKQGILQNKRPANSSSRWGGRCSFQDNHFTIKTSREGTRSCKEEGVEKQDSFFTSLFLVFWMPNQPFKVSSIFFTQLRDNKWSPLFKHSYCTMHARRTQSLFSNHSIHPLSRLTRNQVKERQRLSNTSSRIVYSHK